MPVPPSGKRAPAGALGCPGRAGRPIPSLLCVERWVGRDKHKLVGPRRRVSTQTKDGLCLGGARREDGAVTLEPDSRRERGVRARVGGLDPTPPPLGRAGRGDPGDPDDSWGPDSEWPHL